MADEPSITEIYKAITKEVLKDPEFKRNLGQNTVIFLSVTAAIAAVEIFYGLPIVTVMTTPIAGGVVAFLFASVQVWIRSGKPKTIFFLCPNISCPRKNRFLTVKWSSVPLYRKQKGCPDCGAELIKTCPSGKHYIVSADPRDPDKAPSLSGFCPFCNPKTPKEQRSYLKAPIPALSRKAKSATEGPHIAT